MAKNIQTLQTPKFVELAGVKVESPWPSETSSGARTSQDGSIGLTEQGDGTFLEDIFQLGDSSSIWTQRLQI